MTDVDRRRVQRRRNDVVGELRVGHAAVAHHDLFEQRVADALRRAAFDLSARDHRMNRLADLVHRRDAQRAHLERVGIELDLGDVASPGVACRTHRPGTCPRPTAIQSGCSYCFVTASGPCFRSTARATARRAGRFMSARAALEDLPDDHAGAGRDGRAAVGDDAPCRPAHLDLLVGNAERVGDDLRVHRARALTDLSARRRESARRVRSTRAAPARRASPRRCR